MNTIKDRKSASKQSRREFYTADRMSHVRVSSKMYLCFLCSFVLIYFRMLFISYSNVANNNRPGHETSSKHVKIVWSIKKNTHLAIDVKDESKRIRTRVQLLIQASSLGQTISPGSVCTIIHRQTCVCALIWEDSHQPQEDPVCHDWHAREDRHQPHEDSLCHDWHAREERHQPHDHSLCYDWHEDSLRVS